MDQERKTMARRKPASKQSKTAARRHGPPDSLRQPQPAVQAQTLRGLGWARSAAPAPWKTRLRARMINSIKHLVEIVEEGK